MIAEPAKRLVLLLLCLLIPGLLSIPTSLAPNKSWDIISIVALVALAGLSVLYGLKHRTDLQWLQACLIMVIATWTSDGLLQAFLPPKPLQPLVVHRPALPPQQPVGHAPTPAVVLSRDVPEALAHLGHI